ncbi:endopeptidase La [Chloroflexus sp.]|uniref:endopeptidase La n=1 Tax=Chloroflexus sp. TaxID=1904827 RepID=UPI002ADD9AD2|nr:endopeptidase La [Chloroflexus sp.]
MTTTPANEQSPSPSGTALYERPVLPLLDSVLFPQMLTPLFVSDERAINAVEQAVAEDRLVLAVAVRGPVDELTLGIDDLYPVGVEAAVQRVRRLPDGTLSIVLEGRQRMQIVSVVTEHPALRVLATPLESPPLDEDAALMVEALSRTILTTFEKIVRLSRNLPDDAYLSALNSAEPGELADIIAALLPISVEDRQRILALADIQQRLQQLEVLLAKELDLLELENRIHSQVQQEVDRSQRELFLREQLRAIQRELGQEDPSRREILLLRERAAAAGLPAHAMARFEEELARLELISPMSPEHGMLRTYLDWLISLPWSNASPENRDLRAAAAVLERNHYGLRKVKDRILEYIAVRQLAGPSRRAPILCFVGPPGVGKTSLGQSIAEALGRRFVRLSLGGVHDEAEIRGHRRTYIGALPGRILQRMKVAGTINPVFMLDEVDKLGSDFRGDPAAALLEVLDPEQNSTFSDHYLDLPYDLSQTLFITTANVADDIPDPLLDRMELVELPGYTEDEKLHIARRFLIPRQMTDSGLPPATIHFGDATIHTIIRNYTYEAGVRNLEREIGAICRKIARRIAEGRRYPRQITPRALPKLLGPPRFEIGKIDLRDQVGVAIGMVYTSAGGDIMPVEVVLMDGKGNLLLTGQLGEVMQESAQAALSFARANASRLGIEIRHFDKLDIHVHVPEGATPKDGPSAGVTIATALISALTGRTVRHDIAMTGEITLHGRVLPIGGVKEKVLGAYRAGIRQIILPRRNEHDLVEIPVALRRQLTIHLIERIEQALELVLGPPPPKEPRRAPRVIPCRDED